MIGTHAHATRFAGHLRHGLLQPLGALGGLPQLLLGQAQVRPRRLRDLRRGACCVHTWLYLPIGPKHTREAKQRRLTPCHTIINTHNQDGSIFKIQYGSGPVQGYFSEDDVSLAGLTVEGQVRCYCICCGCLSVHVGGFANQPRPNQPPLLQVFAEITDASGLGAAYKAGQFDGILGLAFDSISVGHVPTVFHNLIEQVGKPHARPPRGVV